MAEDKKGFVLYADLIHTIRKMPEDKAGKLFLTILMYVNDENPIVDDIVVDLVFEPIKRQMKRDLIKYETKKKQWSEAGKASAAKRSTKSTDVEKRSTDSTVTVTDTVIVTVTDTVKLYEFIKTEFLNSGSWHDKIKMELKITQENLEIYIREFLTEISLKELTYDKTDWTDILKEAKKHFISWLKLKLSSGSSPTNEAKWFCQCQNPDGHFYPTLTETEIQEMIEKNGHNKFVKKIRLA